MHRQIYIIYERYVPLYKKCKKGKWTEVQGTPSITSLKQAKEEVKALQDWGEWYEYKIVRYMQTWPVYNEKGHTRCRRA